MSRYASPGYSAAELTAAVRERGREAVHWLMAGEEAGPPPGLIVDPLSGNYAASPSALAAARARRTGDGTGELHPPSSAAKEALSSRVKQQQRLRGAVTKIGAASALANSNAAPARTPVPSPHGRPASRSEVTPPKPPRFGSPSRAAAAASPAGGRAASRSTNPPLKGGVERRTPVGSTPRESTSRRSIRDDPPSPAFRPTPTPTRSSGGRRTSSRLGRDGYPGHHDRTRHSPVPFDAALIDELERSREEEADRARRARTAEIARAAGEATAVATAAAAVAGATAVASAVRRQLQQRRDLPRAPSQTPFYPDPVTAAPAKTTRSVNTEIVVEHRATPSAMSPPMEPTATATATAGPNATASSSYNDNVADPPEPSFHPPGFVPDRRDAEATVMATAIKLEKERRKLREEREICQKRQWDLDARELGLKQREVQAARAIELYHANEDKRGERISAHNEALLRESDHARRDLEGLKNAAIEAEERARRAEARLRMIEEDADRKRDELESLRAKARARKSHDARRLEQEPEWERASLARNRETKLRELLAETFGVVGDVNRALEHGFARCGALAEGVLARVGAVADAAEGSGGKIFGDARELRAESARFEAAWSELRKAYLRGRREVDRHAATIEMESGMSLDDHSRAY